MARRRDILTPVRLLTVVCQVAVGATFVFSGLVKCIDPVGTAVKMTDYLNALGLPWLTGWSMGMAWAMNLLEFVVGTNILFGRNRRVFPWVAAAMMAVFLPLTLWLALTDAVVDCGCFGDAVVLTNWQTLWKNVVLAAGVAILCWRRRDMMAWVDHTPYTFHFYWSLLVAVWLCWMGTRRLPFVDFRPYRPGVNIARAMGAANGAEWTEDYGILYEREGVRREFSLDSLPDEADGWEFVDQVVHRHYAGGAAAAEEPTVEGFYVLNADGDDITEALLADTGYVFLLLSPSLAEASEHDVDRIETVYEYALGHDYGFLCLTARDTEAVEGWRYRTGAEYPVAYSDASVVATMARANPSLMLLRRGTILWKASLPQVDVDRLASASLSEQRYGQVMPISRRGRVFYLLALMFGPILLYLLFELPFKITHKNIKQ